MMGFRGVSNQTIFIANLCLLAGVGLLISAQWEMVKGNTFAYTVLAAFGKPQVRHAFKQIVYNTLQDFITAATAYC